MLVIERKLFSYQLVINMEINFLGQFWTIKDEMLVNKADLWWSGRTIDWNLSRDYSWAGNSDFENTFTLSCKNNDGALEIIEAEKYLDDEDFDIRRRRRRSAENKKYNYGELVKNKLNETTGLFKLNYFFSSTTMETGRQ